ncbi:MAG: hypothetical protein HQL51_02385 [Magnetococcales bacterium]|nr:hypothetical protein [Magnetococcales bacterium]
MSAAPMIHDVFAKPRMGWRIFTLFVAAPLVATWLGVTLTDYIKRTAPEPVPAVVHPGNLDHVPEPVLSPRPAGRYWAVGGHPFCLEKGTMEGAMEAVERDDLDWFIDHGSCFLTVRGMQFRVISSGPSLTRVKLALPGGSSAVGYTPRINVGR